MLSANMQMLTQIWPFLEITPPVLVDWLPWSHTFAGNHDFNLVLKCGGTLYIDAGKPVPGSVLKTVENLRDISPTVYLSVPSGFAMLLPYLENDERLRNNFFKRLQLILYAGAALSQDLWQRLEAVSIQATGKKTPMTTSWGATETSPLSTSAYFPLEKSGAIGIPVPGVQIKMVPNGVKFELRVKGANVTPGYFGRPELTAAAFDEDGFYKIGDAAVFADQQDIQKGLLFAGRVAEDFKLATGTWVHVGQTRVDVLTAAAPVLQDALVAGHDRQYLAILAWPNIQACQTLCGDMAGKMHVESLIRHPELLNHLTISIERYNASHTGSAARIKRVMLMAEPPSIDGNEITDKGYINQAASLENRRDLVERLYAEHPDEAVIVTR